MTSLARGVSASAACTLRSSKLQELGPGGTLQLKLCLSSRQNALRFLHSPPALPLKPEHAVKPASEVWPARKWSSNQRYDRCQAFSLFCGTHAPAAAASRQLFTCRALAGSEESDGAGPIRSKLIFLGTPEVAAAVLAKLLDAAKAERALFEVAAVVTQPPSSRGRGRRKDQPLPTPVAALAAQHHFPSHRIFTPETARDEGFLESLAALQPDVCVTAAYGNVLPNKFLAIPRRGTVNIHPSLLPLYRGASPVQRALEDGMAETGVSLAFTVRAMDAGPIIATERVAVDPQVKAPQLLEDLFQRGTQLLLANLPSILDGSAANRAVEQDSSQASHAAKVASEEGHLSFDQPAEALHNKVRAFAGWPGTRAIWRIVDSEPLDKVDEIPLKIITTRWRPPAGNAAVGEGSQASLEQVVLLKDALEVTCGDGSVLEVVEVQPPGKQVMSARAFWNGLRGRQLYRT